jgi:8-oxo-dGTP pyrophosphatase MutT (NUDIX family)
METTWDGLPIAPDNPRFASIVVWRRGPDGREFLVLHRRHHGPGFAGDWAWTNPAGSRLPGEPVEAAARRELLEEAGLELSLTPLAALADEVALFHAEAPGDAVVRLDHEHDRFEWLPLEEATERCLPAVVGETLRAVDAALGD